MKWNVTLGLMLVVLAFSGCLDSGETQSDDPKDPADPNQPSDPTDPECTIDCEQPCIEDCEEPCIEECEEPCTENCEAPIVDEPPSASFSFSTNSLQLNTDASKSLDPEAEPLSYAWRWGDGNKGTGRLSKHVYNVEGNYTVTLIVTDQGGNTNETSRLVRIVEGEELTGECTVNCGKNPNAEEETLQPQRWYLHHKGSCETDTSNPQPGYFMNTELGQGDDDGCGSTKQFGVPENEIIFTWPAKTEQGTSLQANQDWPLGSSVKGSFFARLDSSAVADIRFTLMLGQQTELGSVSTLELFADDPVRYDVGNYDPSDPDTWDILEWQPTDPSDPMRPYPFVVSPPLSGTLNGQNFDRWDFAFPLEKAIPDNAILKFIVEVIGVNTVEVGYSHENGRASQFMIVPPDQ